MPDGPIWVMIRGKKKGQLMLAQFKISDIYNMQLAFSACFQAARTDILANLTALFIKGSPLNIGLKLAVGLFLRKTNIVA